MFRARIESKVLLFAWFSRYLLIRPGTIAGEGVITKAKHDNIAFAAMFFAGYTKGSSNQIRAGIVVRYTSH